MGNISLNVRQRTNNSDYDPIQLENGIVIELSSTKKGESMELRAEAKKGSANIGTASFSTEGQRIFLQVFPFGDLGAAAAYELAQNLMECINLMIEDE